MTTLWLMLYPTVPEYTSCDEANLDDLIDRIHDYEYGDRPARERTRRQLLDLPLGVVARIPGFDYEIVKVQRTPKGEV